MDTGRKFPITPTPIIQARTRPRWCGHGEKQSKKKKAPGDQQRTNEKQRSQIPPTTKQARNSGVDVPSKKEDRTVFIQPE